MLWGQYLADFTAYLLNYRQFSKHTVVGYRRDVTQFFQFLTSQKLATFDQLSDQHVYDFIKSLTKRGIQARSIYRKIAACRHFFQFLLNQKVVVQNPFLKLTLPRRQNKRLPSMLDVDQMLAILDKMPNQTPIEIRDRCMMEFLYACGLRLSELYQLTIEQVQLIDQTDEVRVLGKGRKYRVIPVHQVLIRCIQRWLAIYPSWQKNADKRPLFINRLGGQLSMRSIQKRVAFWGKHFGLPAQLHPHMFRHSVASHLLESSQNLRLVQKFLGHSNLSSTQVYTHLDFQHLSSVYDQTHPRVGQKKVS